VGPATSDDCPTAEEIDGSGSTLRLFLNRHYIGCSTQEEAVAKIQADGRAQWISIYHQLPKEMAEIRDDTERDNYSILKSDQLPLHAVFRAIDGGILFNCVRSIVTLEHINEVCVEFQQSPITVEEDH
jgi:hypothetical protein